MSHEVLCEKLKIYGFDIGALKWMTSFLENRRQRVVISNKSSKSRDIKIGTPQGSRLSPLLFLCLMADLDQQTKLVYYGTAKVKDNPPL